MRLVEDDYVPTGHEMRHLVWRLAKGILPRAGQVTKVVFKDGLEKVTTTLCRDDLRMKDPNQSRKILSAIRLSDGSDPTSDSESVLPQELVVASVTDSDSVAHLKRNEGDAPPTGPVVQVGDLVHLKLTRQLRVAVLQAKVDMGSAPTTSAPSAQAKDLSNFTQWVGNQLGELLQNAMVKLGLDLVERADLEAVLKEQPNQNFDINPALAAHVGRVNDATHVILCKISPGYNNQARVHLRVVDVETSQVNVDFIFDLQRSQLENWRP
jgi:hypothetical protein